MFIVALGREDGVSIPLYAGRLEVMQSNKNGPDKLDKEGADSIINRLNLYRSLDWNLEVW
jgi:hypothetical protein